MHDCCWEIEQNWPGFGLLEHKHELQDILRWKVSDHLPRRCLFFFFFRETPSTKSLLSGLSKQTYFILSLSTSYSEGRKVLGSLLFLWSELLYLLFRKTLYSPFRTSSVWLWDGRLLWCCMLCQDSSSAAGMSAVQNYKSPFNGDISKIRNLAVIHILLEAQPKALRHVHGLWVNAVQGEC